MGNGNSGREGVKQTTPTTELEDRVHALPDHTADTASFHPRPFTLALPSSCITDCCPHTNIIHGLKFSFSPEKRFAKKLASFPAILPRKFTVSEVCLAFYITRCLIHRKPAASSTQQVRQLCKLVY